MLHCVVIFTMARSVGKTKMALFWFQVISSVIQYFVVVIVSGSWNSLLCKWKFACWLTEQWHLFISEYICMILQTSFVDCLIEQTHPEIYSKDDKDVSIIPLTCEWQTRIGVSLWNIICECLDTCLVLYHISDSLHRHTLHGARGKRYF